MPMAHQALCPVVRVLADEYPPQNNTGFAVYAVFSQGGDSGRFLGLVSSGQATAQQRKFAELLPTPLPAPVAARTPFSDIVAHMDREYCETVAVLDDDGAFLGAVTRASLLNALLQDKTAPNSTAETLHDIAKMLAADSDEPLFNKLVLSLARALNVDYAFIGKVAPDQENAIQIMAFCAKGQIENNFIYDLRRTPCANVVGISPCHYPCDIQRQFPDDKMLQTLGIDSYVGIPLFNAVGVRLGLLVVMDSKPMSDPLAKEAILQICAARVVSEFDRQQSEQTTQQLQKLLNTVIESLPNALFVKSAEDLRYLRVNKACEDLLGYPRGELLGKNDYDFFPRNQAEGFISADREVLSTGKLKDIPLETIHTRHQGERWLHTRKIPIFDDTGKPQYLLGFSEDITEHKLAEDQAARLGRILERSSNEIYVFDATTLKFTQINQGALNNLGYSFAELSNLTPIDLKSTYTHEHFWELLEPLRTGAEETISFETEHERKDGSRYPVEVRLEYSSTETPPVYVAIITDITDQKLIQERLNYLATHDMLTGLPNRRLLLERLQQAMYESTRHERLVAVLFLDLDRFKLVNDTLGHEAGDTLLNNVADRLNECTRPGDTVARLGGDEFTLVLANVAHIDDIAHVAQKIIDVFTQPFLLVGQELFVSASIGITLYPLDDADPVALLKNADAAMYHAKDSGRNNFQFFTPELNQRAERRLDLETALRHALERDEFVLHYQPQLNLINGEVMGMEALLRWQRPTVGMISPLDFIPLAEETGLIVPIGEWVLRAACAQNKAWQSAGLPALHMSVNIAARQFQQQNLADVIARILKETGLDPHWLTLEITESTVMHDPEATIETLQHIGALGVGLSVDDFGTGYSSLSYLKRFPLNYLKIDKSFINDITTNTNDAAIATAIISMAASLEIKVIAEGVETLEQLRFISARGCNAMQGYYFSKPLPAEELAALLATGKHLEMASLNAPMKHIKTTRARTKRPTKKRKPLAKK